MKYEVTDTNQNIHLDYSNKEQSGNNNSSSKEDVKEEDKSEFDQSENQIKEICKKEMILILYLIFRYYVKK